MTEDNNIQTQEKRRLRSFGIIMAVVLSLIASVLLWNDRPVCMYLFVISSLFLISGIAFPRLLKPIEFVWMKLAFILGYIMTRIILTIVFYLAVTPVGLLRQLFSKDPLDMKIDKDAASYWKPVDPKGPKSRPYKPY
jgi:hypothetical protein